MNSNELKFFLLIAYNDSSTNLALTNYIYLNTLKYHKDNQTMCYVLQKKLRFKREI